MQHWEGVCVCGGGRGVGCSGACDVPHLPMAGKAGYSCARRRAAGRARSLSTVTLGSGPRSCARPQPPLALQTANRQACVLCVLTSPRDACLAGGGVSPGLGSCPGPPARPPACAPAQATSKGVMAQLPRAFQLDVQQELLKIGGCGGGGTYMYTHAHICCAVLRRAACQLWHCLSRTDAAAQGAQGA